MGLFDLVSELRTSTPDSGKAARGLKYIGWGCLAGGVWNFILPLVAPIPKEAFPFPETYPVTALITLMLVGIMFLWGARGIRTGQPWGARLGQAALVVILLISIGFMGRMPSLLHFPVTVGVVRFMVATFAVIVLLQFGLPAYFGFRYLGRLATDLAMAAPAGHTSNISPAVSLSPPQRREKRYKDSPVPFGVVGTFVPMVVILLLGMGIIMRFGKPELASLFFMPTFLTIFLGPTIFNYRTSPFERSRVLVDSFTGGGSIFLFHGSWPFFRLLVYRDAVEIRVMFHRFLIPFDLMAPIPQNVGFFSSGVLIKSELPEVPSSIRFSGFGMKKIVKTLYDTQRAYLTAVCDKSAGH